MSLYLDNLLALSAHLPDIMDTLWVYWITVIMARDVQIVTLGRLAVEQDGEELTGFVSQKTQVLFAYLVAHPHVHQREVIAAQFWNNTNGPQAMKNLRTVLSSLQKQLGDYLLVDRQTVCVNKEAPIRFDVQDFDAALDAIIPYKDFPGYPPDNVLAQVKAALKLYKGDFMVGVRVDNSPDLDTWITVERGRLRDRMIEALYMLSGGARATGDFAIGIDYARQIVALDPLWEPGQRRLIELLAFAGNRAEAVVQYNALVDLLEEELAIEPEQETVDLINAVKRGTLATPTPPKHHLPPTLDIFIDRPQEIGHISGYLAKPDCRLVTLLGPGGVGKTRLALETAIRHRNSYPDGVHFVPLAPVETEDFVAQQIMDVMEIEASRDYTHPERVLADTLRDRRALLVLDNIEHLLGAVDLLGMLLLNAPKLKIVVTSRERLNLQGEWVVPVNGMDVTDDRNAQPHGALALFDHHARRTLPDFDLAQHRADVLRVCQLVDGLPLAIEIAAAWMASLSPAQVADEISRNLDFLISKRRDLPERHRGIRALLDYTWSSLNPMERNVLMGLSVFRGGFDLRAAQIVTGGEWATVARFVDKSLVRRDSPTRYSMHELMRRYAYQRLSTASNAGVIHAMHCEYYLDWLLSYNGTADYVTFYEQIDADYDNIRQALNWCKSNDDRKILTAYCGVLNEYWLARDRIAEGYLWLMFAAGDEETELISGAQAQVLQVMGRFAVRLAKFDIAKPLFERSMAYFAEHDPTGQGYYRAHNNLGALALYTGDFEAGRDHFQKTFELASNAGNVRFITLARKHLGQTHLILGDYVAAETELNQALTMYRETVQAAPTNLLNTQLYLGYALMRQGRYDDATARWQECRVDAERFGSRRLISNCDRALGIVALRQGDLGEARYRLRESLVLILDAQTDVLIVDRLEAIAELFCADQRYEVALQLYGLTQTRRQKMNMPAPPADAAETAASIAEVRKQLDADLADATWATGELLSLSGAVELALTALKS